MVGGSFRRNTSKVFHGRSTIRSGISLYPVAHGFVRLPRVTPQVSVARSSRLFDLPCLVSTTPSTRPSVIPSFLGPRRSRIQQPCRFLDGGRRRNPVLSQCRSQSSSFHMYFPSISQVILLLYPFINTAFTLMFPGRPNARLRHHLYYRLDLRLDLINAYFRRYIFPRRCSLSTTSAELDVRTVVAFNFE